MEGLLYLLLSGSQFSFTRELTNDRNTRLVLEIMRLLFQVMPALHTRIKPAEEGWSKAHEDDLLEKTYTATFPAFKFPDRERLHVSCGVQLCKGFCPDVSRMQSSQFSTFFTYFCIIYHFDMK